MPRGTPIDYEAWLKEMKKWLNNYPKATFHIESTELVKSLKYYSRSEEEYEKLKEKYNEFKHIYSQLRMRQAHGELPEKIYNLCVEYGIGGVFPYSETVQENAKKYKQKQSVINSIILRYGSVEKVLESYYDDTLDEYGIEIVNGLMDRVIDVSNNPQSNSYEEFVRTITRQFELQPKDIIMFKSSRIDELISKLPDTQKVVIKSLFGLGQEKVNVSEWAKQRNISKQGIYELKDTAIRKLTKAIREGSDYFTFEQLREQTAYSKDDRKRVDEIQKKLFVSGAMLKTKDNEKVMSSDVKVSLKIEESYDEMMQIFENNKSVVRQELAKNPTRFRIEQLQLSEETIMMLKKQGISTVAELTSIDPRVIKTRITPIKGRVISAAQKNQMMDEIRAALKNTNPNLRLYGETLEEEKKGPQRLLTRSDFGKGTLAELSRYGITTVEDLSTRTESYLRVLNNIGDGTIIKIKSLLAEYGLSLAEEKEERNNRGRKDTSALVVESMNGIIGVPTRRDTLEALEDLLKREVAAAKERATKEKQNATKDKGDIGE